MLETMNNGNLFTPSAKSAEYFKNSIKLNLCKSYEYLFSLSLELFDNQVKEQFKVKIEEMINSQKSLSGYAHAIHTNLVSSVEIKDASLIKKYINEFLASNLLVDKLKILNFSPENMGYNKFEAFKAIVNVDDNYHIELTKSDLKNFDQAKNSIYDALITLHNSDNELYHEITTLVIELVLLQNNTNNLVSSGTSFKTYGTIFVASNINESINFFIESIVHEAAHLYLFAIALNDSLVLNADEERFAAPLRKDKRTMTGIYHAVFSHSTIDR